VGSRSAPIGTPPRTSSYNIINDFGRTWPGSHFKANLHFFRSLLKALNSPDGSSPRRPIWRDGVDGIPQAVKIRILHRRLLDHREQMADRAGMAVRPYHNRGVASSDVTHQAGHYRQPRLTSVSVFPVHCDAAGGAPQREHDACTNLQYSCKRMFDGVAVTKRRGRNRPVRQLAGAGDGRDQNRPVQLAIVIS
jgi:hypothetical protein